MRHFPIFLDLRGQNVAVAGGGETAVSKLRLLLKTEARITVHAEEACAQIRSWHDAGRLSWIRGRLDREHAICRRLVYAANDDAHEDARVKAIALAAGALVNIVDDLEGSQFITPAIVDRDPVTVAIGTEGTAPVLARRIKALNEEQLNPQLGTLARIAERFRPAAEAIAAGPARRRFWSRFFDEEGSSALEAGGIRAAEAKLVELLAEALAPRADLERKGKVVLVGAGPGDPELLTLKARRVLHEADVVVYDRLVAAEILELARREAILVEVGKMPGGPAWKQDDINALLIEHARNGAVVARLKSGDPGIFGRADEEIDALTRAGIEVEIVPGITAAAAAAADLGVSLTRRGRNRAIGFLTAHDAQGFAEHDWRGLARRDSVCAIYMGLRAARFVQGRLMLHGAEASRPVSIVENASRPDRVIASGTLGRLPELLSEHRIKGPAVIFIGIAATAAAELPQQDDIRAAAPFEPMHALGEVS